MGKSTLTVQTSLAKPERSASPESGCFGLGEAPISGPSMGTPCLIDGEDEDCPSCLKNSKNRLIPPKNSRSSASISLRSPGKLKGVSNGCMA